MDTLIPGALKPGDTIGLIAPSEPVEKEDIEKALALGVDGYIVKASATPSEVVTKVTEIAQHLKPASVTSKL